MEIETLGDAWTHSGKVFMWCAFGPYTKGMQRGRECNYSKELDLESLICTRGRAFPVALLGSRLKCPRCGSMKVRVLIRFPDNTRAQRVQASW